MAACDQCCRVINSEKEASVIIEVINHEKRGRRDLCWSCAGELAKSVGLDLEHLLYSLDHGVAEVEPQESLWHVGLSGNGKDYGEDL